jgi:hypothetical protein
MTPTKPLLQAAFAFALAGVAHAGERPGGPADPAAAVPATRYQGSLPYRPPAPGAASADRNWKTANQTVAGYDSMRLTMGMHGAPAPTAPQDSPPPPAHQHDSQPAPGEHAHHHGGGK